MLSASIDPGTSNDLTNATLSESQKGSMASYSLLASTPGDTAELQVKMAEGVVVKIQELPIEYKLYKDKADSNIEYILDLYKIISNLQSDCRSITDELLRSFSVITNKWEVKKIHGDESKIEDMPFKDYQNKLVEYAKKVNDPDTILCEEDIPRAYIKITMQRREKIIANIAAIIQKVITLQYYVNNIMRSFNLICFTANEENKKVLDRLCNILLKIRSSNETLQSDYNVMKNKPYTYTKEEMKEEMTVQNEIDHSTSMVEKFIKTSREQINIFFEKSKDLTKELTEAAKEELIKVAKEDLYTTTKKIEELFEIKIKPAQKPIEPNSIVPQISQTLPKQANQRDRIFTKYKRLNKSISPTPDTEKSKSFQSTL